MGKFARKSTSCAKYAHELKQCAFFARCTSVGNTDGSTFELVNFFHKLPLFNLKVNLCILCTSCTVFNALEKQSII